MDHSTACPLYSNLRVVRVDYSIMILISCSCVCSRHLGENRHTGFRPLIPTSSYWVFVALRRKPVRYERVLAVSLGVRGSTIPTTTWGALVCTCRHRYGTGQKTYRDLLGRGKTLTASNICTFGVMVQTDYSVWCFIYSLGIGSHGMTLVIWDDQDCNSILNGIRLPQPNWHKILDWGWYMIEWCWQNIPPKCMLVGGAVGHLDI